MRTILFLLAFIISFSLDSSGQNHDIEAIKKLNQGFITAIQKKDSASLSKILAEDFVLIAPNGVKQDKKDNLRNLLMPNIETVSVSFDSVDVRLLTSDIGLLSAWITFVYKVNGGNEMTGKNCYMDVYMKRKGKWVAVAAHVTSLDAH